MSHIERFLKWRLCDVLVPRREYVCRICGQTLFYRGTEENEDYKAIALKMERDSYNLEAKLIKYMDSFRGVKNVSH